ncbi:MAG: hypothetical protein JWQ01_2907 [Massilia sp.]|jgi:hypothetical protein|nr:hypothetical protein [Massilia sp.]
MTTLSFKSGSIYDTLYVSQVKKNALVSASRPHTVAFNVYDASQKKSGQPGAERRALMSCQSEKINHRQD